MFCYNFVLVSWNRLVSYSPAVMRKFLLMIDHRSLSLENAENFEELLTVRRNFVSMKLVFATDSSKERIEKVMQHFGGMLLDLELREVKMKESDLLLKLLKHTPELEVLHLNIWKSKDSSDQLVFQSIPVELRKLKKIVSTEHANWKIFNSLLVPRLTQLECHGGDDDFEPHNFQSFLQTLPNLESLMLDFKHLSKMGSTFPFRLKKLACSTFDCSFDENLRRFFLSQYSTIQELAAACVDPAFYEFIFTKLKNLERLSSNMSRLPNTRDFYFRLKPMPFLKELEVTKFSGEISMRGVLRNCPKLITLAAALDQNFPDEIDFVANHNPELQSLSMIVVRATMAHFEFLKTLQISMVDDANNLIGFLKTNPTVEIFVVSNQRENFDDDFLDFLMYETNIKHVSIHGRSVFEVYEKVKSGYGKWKTLELSYRDGRLNSPLFVQYNFPENPDDWNPHEELGIFFS